MILLLRHIWERVSLYLPVILMAVLALGTYWLVRSTPLLGPLEPAAPKKHEPDYFMRKFSIKTFDADGRLKSEVFGADARHYPDTDTLEIEGVRIRSFDQDGGLSTASAKHAVTNGDATEVQLLGEARVVREPVVDKAGKVHPRLEFRSEYLHAYTQAERVKTHKPVELTRGADQFTADAMDFDNHAQVLQLQGRVRGTLKPEIVK